MKLFRDEESHATVGGYLMLIAFVVLVYAVIYEFAVAIGRQAGISW